MAEHTPGPWEISRPSMTDPQSETSWDIFTPTDSDHRCEYIGEFHGNSGNQASAANARLIAAAPELLAALEALAEVSWTNLTGGHQDLIEDAWDAIRKAKGEST